MGLQSELEACLRDDDVRPLEAFYLTSYNPDFLEAADCQLTVGGHALQAHTAILAARAPAFSALLAISPPREVTDPFGIDSLPHLLLLLRLCYRPEDAEELPQMLDWLPGLLPVLHRVGAIRLLGGRQGWLQRGVDLPASATTEQLLALLDASAPLTGMENLAGACAARIINELSDAHPARHGGEHTDGHLGQASLGLLPGLPLHRLSAPAKDLLLRAALTVIADARGRSRLRFVTAAAAAAPQGQAQAPLLGQLGRGDVWLMAATAGRCGSYCWAAGTHDAADLEDGPPANLVSPVFSIAGYRWRLRLVGLTGDLPDDAIEWAHLDEDDPEPPRWMLLTLEAADPAGLPEQGLEVHFRACLADCRGSEYLSIRKEVSWAAVTRQAPSTAVQALCDARQLAVSCLQESQHQPTYRLQLQLDLGVGDCAPDGHDSPDL